jgi:hypothetical protein
MYCGNWFSNGMSDTAEFALWIVFNLRMTGDTRKNGSFGHHWSSHRYLPFEWTTMNSNWHFRSSSSSDYLNDDSGKTITRRHYFLFESHFQYSFLVSLFPPSFSTIWWEVTRLEVNLKIFLALLVKFICSSFGSHQLPVSFLRVSLPHSVIHEWPSFTAAMILDQQVSDCSTYTFCQSFDCFARINITHFIS